MLIYGKAIRHKTLKRVVVSALAILILLGASSMASEMNPYGDYTRDSAFQTGMDDDGVNPGLDKLCLKYEDCPVWDGDLDTKVYYDLMKLNNGTGVIAKSDFNWNVHLYLCHQNKLLDSINGEGAFERLAILSADDGMIPCPINVNPHWSYDWESHMIKVKLNRLTMLWPKDFQAGPKTPAGRLQNSIDKIE